jgi:hypothetical protein
LKAAEKRRDRVTIKADGPQDHGMPMALVGNLLRISEVRSDHPHSIAKRGKNLEHLGPLKIGEDRLPILDDLFISVGRVKDRPQSLLITLRHGRSYYLIQVQINEAAWLVGALCTRLFQSRGKKNGAKDGGLDGLAVFAEIRFVRAWHLTGDVLTLIHHVHSYWL